MTSSSEDKPVKSVTLDDNITVSMINDHGSSFAHRQESTGDESRLSEVGRLYDVDGDGKLDEAEQAMRDLDVTGRGYLSNSKVYELMVE